MIKWFTQKPTNTPYTSDNLFHLVGFKHPGDHINNYETLNKILNDKCVSYSCKVKGWGETSYVINWNKSLLDEGLIFPKMTCYADIPFSSLDIHVKKYGKFGVSFKREYLIKFGARPVMYVPLSDNHWGSPFGEKLLLNIEAIYKGFHEHVAVKNEPLIEKKGRFIGDSPQNEIQAIDQIDKIVAKDFLAFIKPFNSHLDSTHPDNFYMEREWRKLGNLVFNPDDVVKIIVAKGFESQLAKAFPHYKSKIIEI